MQRQSHADWNDALLLLTVAHQGSFARAASELGIDKATVSRRIANLEHQAGAPLVRRRTSGADLTEFGKCLLEAAETASEAIDSFRRLLRSGAAVQSPVTLSCPEGLATYVIGPALAAPSAVAALGIEPCAIPRLDVRPLGMPADISILLVKPSAPVPCGADYHVRRIGRMRFAVLGSRSYAKAHGMPDSVRTLQRRPLMQHSVYEANPAFGNWTELVHHGGGPVLTSPTSSGLHRAALAGMGLTLLPDFSECLDPSMAVVDSGLPPIDVEMWISSHPDTLRLPSVRAAYDGLGTMFASSPWFGSS